MKKILLLLALLLSGCSFFTSKQPAALKINTTPQSTVFVDGKHMGTTPFLNEQLEAGEITLKIVPEQGSGEVTPWEGLIELTAGVVTVVNHEFATETTYAGGEILALQPNNRTVSSLAVVSQPDAAVVRVDGESKGFTPLNIDELEAGDHQLLIASPGYQERTINVKAQTGYRLTVSVQLAKETTLPPVDDENENSEATDSADQADESEEGTSKISTTPTPSPKAKVSPTKAPTSPTPTSKVTQKETVEKPYVKINDTPTGWLRVRSEASLTADEVGKVNPGETFPLKDVESGWYQIEYEAGKLGWIAGQYAEKYE